jgi:hypothetical protein
MWRLTEGPHGSAVGRMAELAGGLAARRMGRAWAESGARPAGLVGGLRR